MVIDMNDSALGTIAQLHAFLEGTLEVSFAPFADDAARYAHIASVVRRFGYAKLSRPDKGVVLRYLARTSGYSRAQLTRLLARVMDGAPMGKRYRAPAHAFARRYTPADVDLLVAVDRAHGCLSGPATAHLLRRAWVVHGGGMDEMTTTAETRVAEWRDGQVRLFSITPEAVGLSRAILDDLRGGEPAANAQALRDLLAGRTGPYRDIVRLNAAAAFIIGEKVETLSEGVALAAQIIDDGRAQAALNRLVEATNA